MEIDQLFFQANLSKRRIWLLKGNVELYSLKQSFEKGVVWKFTLITSDDNELQVKGTLEKIENGKNVKFEVDQGRDAVYGNFLKVKEVVRISSLKEFPVFSSENVAFVLRVSVGFADQLKNFTDMDDEKKINGIAVSVFTSQRIFTEEEVLCVRGHLILEGVENLEVCAKLLAEFFPRKIITWLTYCTNVRAWTRNWNVYDEFESESEEDHFD